ncbi:MAG: hypothetical protein IJ733_18615 [Lachnospiraceae bacterium]|nr:hypothetical protein [Lachnospiraceae bacterium]
MKQVNKTQTELSTKALYTGARADSATTAPASFLDICNKFSFPKRWKSFLSLLLIAAMLFHVPGVTPKKAAAASYSVIAVSLTQDKQNAKKTVSGTTITIKLNSDYENYTITTEKKNTKKTVTKKGFPLCVSDGKSLYYAEKKSNGKFTIFQADISSGSKKKLVSGVDQILDSSGRYLYYVTRYSYEEHAGKCYALDLQTKKMNYITKSAYIKVIKGNKILINDYHMEVINIAFYTADLNGSGVKLIDKGFVYKVTKSKIYYFKSKTTYGTLANAQIKKYSCSLTGANKKAISGWTKKIPSTYEKYL